MGQNRSLTVRPGNFAGNSKLYSSGPEGLAAQLRSLQAQVAVLLANQGGAFGGTAAVDFSVADSSTAVGRTVITGDATGGTVENQLTLSQGAIGVATGHPVIFEEASGGDLPLNIVQGTTYYIIRVKVSGVLSSTIFQIADQNFKAHLGEAFVLADDGGGSSWILRQIALPAQFVTHDSLAALTGTLDTQANVTADTILETLASAVNLLALLQADLGMPVVDPGTLTGAITTVAAINAIATANTGDNDAIDLSSAQGIASEINNAVVTVVASVNDVAAALGADDHIEFLNIAGAEEATDPPTVGFTASTTATSAAGGAVDTVSLVDWNAALIAWEVACGVILQRVSVVSADAQGIAPEDFGFQLLPGTAPTQVVPGLLTRQR